MTCPEHSGVITKLQVIEEQIDGIARQMEQMATRLGEVRNGLIEERHQRVLQEEIRKAELTRFDRMLIISIAPLTALATEALRKAIEILTR